MIGDLMQAKTEELMLSFQKQMDDIVIEGLKRKGFEFNSNYELANFIKLNCSALKVGDITTYSVNNETFLIYKENLNVSLPTEDNNTFNADFGSYSYC